MLNPLKQLFNSVSKAYAHMPLPLLFTEQFMQTYTDFETWEAFVEATGLHVLDERELERIFQESSKLHAATRFSSWAEMRSKAEEAYYERHPFGLYPTH